MFFSNKKEEKKKEKAVFDFAFEYYTQIEETERIAGIPTIPAFLLANDYLNACKKYGKIDKKYELIIARKAQNA